MNRSFKGGMNVVTGIRNSKNFGDNWISAGYAIGWIFQTALLNGGRSVLGIPCFVNGTGFLIGAEVLKQKGGWNYFTLTEDCEFTVDCALSGIEIGICADAEFYDEQPTSFRVAWTQRLRWMRGKYQAFGKYWKASLKGIFSKKTLVYMDAFSNIFPAGFLIFVSAVLTVIQIAASSAGVEAFIISLVSILVKSYLSMLILGLVSTALWWNRIHEKPLRKIFLTLFYPIHIALYIPITFTAAFKSVEWTPIKHNVTKSIRDISKEEKLPVAEIYNEKVR